MYMIDPKLRVLQLVERYGTVTSAAQALHYTPSAVSHQLRQLAEELGVELVAPAGRGIRLTPAAEIVLGHAQALTAQVERARADLAASAEQVRGRLTLCGFSTAATYLLPPVAARLQQRHRNLAVRVIEAEPARCFDLLLSQEADLAVVNATTSTPAGSDTRFEQRPLLDDPLDLVVPAGHRLASRERVHLAEAAQEDWILARPGSTYHHLVMSACAAAGFTPGAAHYADEWHTGTSLVALGFGIVLVPRLAPLTEGAAITRIPLHGEPAPVRRLLSATRQGGRDLPLVGQALQMIAETAVELGHDPWPADGGPGPGEKTG